ncbi:MAG: MATE family efflux transporter [Catenulispora sp.]|nr:MATE family efflux transporter [Catenulispora sp.]
MTSEAPHGFRPTAEDAHLLRLAVPALGNLVAEPLFLLADSAIVGHLGTPQLAGLAAASALLATLTYLCVFLAYGTTAAVGRRIGAGDLPGAVRQGVDGMWLGVFLGVVLGLGGIVFAEPLVRLFGASPEAVPYGVTYLRVASLGQPAMLLVLASTGVLRGLQDIRATLVVAAGGAGANVVLNFVLVYPAGMGIAGSATGTVLTQYGMAAAYSAVVYRAARRHGAPLRPDREGIKQAATASVPLLIRTIMLRIALLAGTILAARYGTEALAAQQVAWSLWGVLALVLDALAIAGQAWIPQLLGASDVPGARRATRRTMQWGVVTGVVLGLVVLATRQLFIPLFTDDPTVRHLLSQVLLLEVLFLPVAAPVFVLDGILIGAGDGRYLAWAGTATTAAYLAAALTSYGLDGGLTGLWWALGVFMLARLLVLTARVRTDRWLVTGAGPMAGGDAVEATGEIAAVTQTP